MWTNECAILSVRDDLCAGRRVYSEHGGPQSGRRRPYLRANLPDYTSGRAVHGRRTSEQQRTGPGPQHYARMSRLA